jgi:hypothetical protein
VAPMRPRDLASRAAVVAAVAGALTMAPAAGGAPATISGADGDQWRSPPTYLVTGGERGYLWGWASTGLEGASASSPFEVVLTGLADGEHQLVVWQSNRGARGPTRERSVRAFVVDTSPPAAVVLSGPSAVARHEPLPVAWTGGEPGATFTWSVVVPGAGGGADVLVQGPVDTMTPSATITGLPAGSFEVRVTQRDGAGNVGPVATLAVSVTPAASAALVPLPAASAPPTATPPALMPTGLRLPQRNAARLRPRRAVTLRAVRPVLRWTRGPTNTTLYNVQLFRVRPLSATAPADAVAFRKVRSAFPRSNRFRTPRLARGECYVWRVWPFLAGRYSKKPLGVSHFCIARTPPARR